MDSSDGHPIWLILFLLLTAADFILEAVGTALQSVPDSILEDEEAGSELTARIHALKHDPARLIRANWLYTIWSVVPAVMLTLRHTGWMRAVCAVLCCSVLYLAGRSIPQSVGKRYAFRLGSLLYRPALILTNAAFPFYFVLNLITRGFTRILGFDPGDMEDEVTEDEILNMVNEGHEQGVLDEHEAEMISNIFQWGDTEAADIMTHRKHICAIDGSQSLSEVIRYIVSEANSRFPVYEESIDNITGVLHLRDAVAAQSKGGYDNWKIRDIPGLLRPVLFIPETRNIDDLFRSMQARKMQMVIVVDEYGETAGLVTMEDILEEIVGNILDEYDVDEHFIFPDGPDAYRMAGLTPLEQAEETLGISFDTDEYDTLNGFLISRLDRIPTAQDHSVVRFKDWTFTITKVDRRMIQWVKAVKQQTI